MTMQFGVLLPQAWNRDLEESKDPQELIMSFFPRTNPEQLRRFAREFIV
jgi:hypothetical protein